MLKQSLPLVLLCGIGGLFTGNTLGLMIDLFERIPGLLVIVPGIIALRGNISTAFGSRLGSAYHLGIINEKNLWNDELKQNIIGSLALSLFISIIMGILAYVTTVFFFHLYPDPALLISIVIIAGLISGFILTGLTIIIIYLVFKRGYDPDNITGPALATVGDIITIFCIFGTALFMEAIV